MSDDDEESSFNLDGDDPVVALVETTTDLPIDMVVDVISIVRMLDPDCTADKGKKRTAECQAFAWLHDSTQPKDNPMIGVAAQLYYTDEIVEKVVVAYDESEALEGRAPPISFTSVPTIGDLNRSHNVVVLTSTNVMQNINIIANALVGFPGRAVDEATPYAAMSRDVATPHAQFTSADLPDCAVVWGVDGNPYFARVRKVVRSVLSLREHWAAVVRDVDEIIEMTKRVASLSPIDKKKLGKTKLSMARVPEERAAEIKAFAALMLKRLNVIVPPAIDKETRVAQKRYKIPVSATASTIFLVLYEYTEMPRKNMTKIPELYADLIVGDSNADMRKYIVERENLRTVTIRMQLHAPKKRILTQYQRVPITPGSLYRAVREKYEKDEKAKTAKRTPKKAPTVADVAKTTPANTEKAIAHVASAAAMTVDECVEKADSTVVVAAAAATATAEKKAPVAVVAKKRKAAEKPEKAAQQLETPERVTKKSRAPPVKTAPARAATVDAAPGTEIHASNCRLVAERFEKFYVRGTIKRSFGIMGNYDIKAGGLSQTLELKRVVGGFLQMVAYLGIGDEVRAALNDKWADKDAEADSLSM